MADRYWVGGTASWDGTAGTKWATTDGGAGGAAVPTSADDVYFTAASGTVTVTVSVQVNCGSLTCTGFTGTLAGAGNIQINSNVTLVSGMSFTHTGQLSWSVSGSGGTLTTAGKTVGSVGIGSVSVAPPVVLGDALTCSGAITLTQGTFTTNDYAVTATSLSSSNSNTRTINLGSSTVTLSGATPIQFATPTNLTLNAGASTIICSVAGPTFNGGGQTFYDVNLTSTNSSSALWSGDNTFNNFSVAGRSNAGIFGLILSGSQTINGTLTLSAGTNATMRTFVRADAIGATKTLTCAAVSATDIDFRDITIAGAAAPVSGTRLGDCKGNSGITFDAAKTVYWAVPVSDSIGSSSARWALTNGGSTSLDNFPLAQDTMVFPSSPTPYPPSGQSIIINASYNLGTIDMGARTSNTMTLTTSTNTPQIYGNWINGTGTTLSGTGTLTFAGRGSQTITSAGKTFTQGFTINTPGGSVTLQDAFTTTRNISGALLSTQGMFDANGYNVTLSGSASSVTASGTLSRTIAIGTGTWTLAGGGWGAGSATELTITGTGIISLTSASAKSFSGGGIQTYPTINQGGTGTLTIAGSNKFANITNTAIGRVAFTGGTINEFTDFNLNGVLGNLLSLGSTNTTQAILKKPTAWNVGLLSTDAGNNTGLSFTGTDPNYLSISYINGQISATTSSVYYGSTNVTVIYYGSTPVTAMYYGSTQVF